VVDLRTTAVPATADARQEGARECDYKILFIGNSHSAMYDLPQMVGQLLDAGDPSVSAYCEIVPQFGFLEDHWRNPQTRKVMESLEWTHAVLQAQKYSTSGRFEYSTDAAGSFIQWADENSIQPIMYPEWRQRGRAQEGERVQALHESIARGTKALVAPVGMAWDRVLARFPELELYAADGNHATEVGAYVTACTLYATIADKTPEGLPNLCRTPLSDEQVQGIQACCWEAIQEYTPDLTKRQPAGDG
jgi:hypothetical protein